MLSGLRAACEDLRYTADAFFDKHSLYDISVVSTMGLTEADVEAIAQIEGVQVAEGAFSTKAYTKAQDKTKSIEFKTISSQGINAPHLLEGMLPSKSNHVVVPQAYMEDTEKKLGDTVVIAEDVDDEEDAVLKYQEYVITGVIVDVTDINSQSGAVSFRSNSSMDYAFYVLPEAIDSDIYTVIYVLVENAQDLLCYSTAYEEKIDNVISAIDEQVREAQVERRFEEVTKDARKELADAIQEADEEFAKADKEIADAKKELEDGKKELADGEQKLEEARAELEDAKSLMNTNPSELAAKEQELIQKEQELLQQQQELSQQEQQLRLQQQQLQTQMDELTATWKNLEQLREQSKLGGMYAGQLSENYIGVPQTDIEELLQQNMTMQVQVNDGLYQVLLGLQQIETGKQQLEFGLQQIAAGKEQIATAKYQITTGVSELESAEQELADAEAEIEENKKKLADGEKELAENEIKLAEEKEKAEKEIADAKKELAELELPEWYIQDRSSLSGYNNVETDADCIQSVGTAFPIIFFTVAILISLTTITRMVEEERGLIGTYKALGFTDKEIRRKYVIYAASASIFGGILGDICGYLVLPKIIFIIFGVMYVLPDYLYRFDLLYGLGGILLFVVGIVGATWIACEAELRHMPATLMKPKAPKAGSRVFLERIKPIWNRLSFLNKVTARNLFRYKKRMLMTIGGIMGCTALVLCGFVIKDAVTNLMVGQYEKIYYYDMMVITEDDSFEECKNDLEKRKETEQLMSLRIESVKVKNVEGEELAVQLMVIPEEADIASYVNIKTKEDEELILSQDNVYLTQNAVDILALEQDETVTVQTMDLHREELQISDFALNYMGNNLYMTQSRYEEVYGTYEPNAMLILLSEACEDAIAYDEELAKEDGILSTMCVAKMQDEFQIAFTLINMVVYIIIIMAAGLALVVLFTLSTTNISERERELATIKVLGFFDKEVHLYVNKETLILTGIGIIIGMPVGNVLGGMLTAALKMPSIYFAIDVQPISYVLSMIISFGFALIVDFLTDKTLDHIDPVEALKSIE